MRPVYVTREASWHLQPRVETIPAKNVINPCYINEKKQLVDSAQRSFSADFIFPIIHGTMGEDGAIQGFCEFMSIPYAGVGLDVSAICMDKRFMRMFFAKHKVPQVRYISLSRNEFQKQRIEVLKKIEDEFELPLFTKPCNMGSSVGVFKVSDFSKLQNAIEKSFEFDRTILIEQGAAVREVEIAIMGSYLDYQLSAIGEIVPNHEFYSYEAKYEDMNGAELIIGADIENSTKKEIERITLKVFSALGAEGFARVDFFVLKKSGKVLLNEVNTLPGFTSISMFPKLFEAAGVSAAEAVKEIINIGIDRHFSRSQIKRTHK